MFMLGSLIRSTSAARFISGWGGCFIRGLAHFEEDSAKSIFDNELKSKQRDRAAFLSSDRDPLHETIAERLLDRLDDCKGRTFASVAILSGASAYVLPKLLRREGLDKVVVIDTSTDQLQRLREHVSLSISLDSQPSLLPSIEFLKMEGEVLPVEPESFDLVIACLGLHWFNDLPISHRQNIVGVTEMRRRGEERRTVARPLVCSCSYFLSHTHPVSQAAIAQCRFSLRPDGLFLGALFGGDTLHELRVSCSLAQMANEGGVSSVVSPFAQVRDAGNLLTRADMAMPTVDLDTYKLQYHCPTEIIRHLRSSAESNAAIHRQISLKRSTALAAAAIYRSMFGEEVNGKISYPATYHVIYLTGWSPHESQQRPKERGSATVSFQDLATGLIANENSTIAGDSNGILTPPVKSDQ